MPTQFFVKMDPSEQTCGYMPTLIMGWSPIPFWPPRSLPARVQKSSLTLGVLVLSLLQQSSASVTSFVLGRLCENKDFTPFDKHQLTGGPSTSYLRSTCPEGNPDAGPKGTMVRAVQWGTEVYVCCAQSCPTLCDPMDCSLPGSSVQGIFPTQGLNLCLLHCRWVLYYWATWEELTLLAKRLSGFPQPHSSLLMSEAFTVRMSQGFKQGSSR